MEYAMGKIESMETYAPAIISGAHHYWHILILGDGLFRFYYYSLLEKKMHFTVDATTVVVAGACQLMRPTSNRIPFPERPERRPPKEKKKKKRESPQSVNAGLMHAGYLLIVVSLEINK